MKRNQWSAVLLAILLFCCGVAVGALAHRYYSATVVNAKGEDLRQHYLSEMSSKLGLTSAQVSQLEAIMDETKAKTRAVRDQYRPEMLKVRNEQINRVKSILTPQQIPTYEQLVAERERRAREQEEHDRKEEQKRAAMRNQQLTH
jgi:Spy/CpxP family protein refolding chaperone